MHKPDTHESSKAGRNLRTIAIVGVFILLAFYTLWIARAFFLPVTLACLLSFLLRPVVRALEKVSVPRTAAAAIVLAAFLGTVALGLIELYGPALKWIEGAPNSLRRVEKKVRRLLEPAEHMGNAMDQVEKITGVDDEDDTKKMELKEPGPSHSVFSWTRRLLFGPVVMFVLLYFLLASGDLIVRRLVQLLPRVQDKKRVVDIARETEQKISGYLFTLAVINACLGGAVGLVMHFLQMPNPLLWGVMAALLNFIPLLGPIFSFFVIAMVSLLQFDSLGQACIAPLFYLGLHSLESNVITPMILGKRLALNTIVIFVSLVFWGWLWGVPGAAIAVPLLMTFKIICEQIHDLRPISDFLSK